MSEKHLAKGSTEPPRVEGLLRLYSMKFCPFAQRARLVLLAKEIPHDVVNINLIEKPEWYFKINSKGLVPAVLDGDKVVVESLDVSEYLDEKYPQNPLYPAEPSEKNALKELIEKIGPVVTVFSKCFMKLEDKTPEEWVKAFEETLNVFEEFLAKKGTIYFGGEKPGMVDYMLWPWAERAPVLAISWETKLPFRDDQFPLLRKWRKTLKEHPVVVSISTTPEQFWKVVQIRLKTIPADYDII